MPGSPLVLSVGRLAKYKGHHRILNALPALSKLSPKARLGLIGSSPYEQRLRASQDEIATAVLELAIAPPSPRPPLPTDLYRELVR